MLEFEQLDLFEEHTQRFMRGRNALINFDLPSAKHEFEAFLSRHPDNTDARHGLLLADQLLSRLFELEAKHGDYVTALLLLENDIDDVCCRGWHRHLAWKAEHHKGNGCYIDGVPVGVHWLLGGALEDAERSLRDSLERMPRDAQAHAYLGDVFFQKNDLPSARSQYLIAIFTDPSRVEIDNLADPEVAALPSVARNEYEMTGDPTSWIPAVGTVEGIFQLPPPILPGLHVPVTVQPKMNLQGFTFYRCLLEERASSTHEERVRIRRRMKALCLVLFNAYLGRFYSHSL